MPSTHPFGYETVGPGGYATGEDETGAFLPMRPMLPSGTAQQQPARTLSPAAMQAIMQRGAQLQPAIRQQLARAVPAAPASGLTPAQANDVAAMIESWVARMVPYGDVPPRPQPDEAMFPMGLGSATLTAAAPAGNLSAQPQRAFRGERLVLSVFRSAGAVGIPVVIAGFNVGDYKQLVGGGSLPVEVFASDAFGVRLMLDASIPGVLYQIQVQALAPIAAGESIIIAGAVIGRAGEAAAR